MIISNLQQQLILESHHIAWLNKQRITLGMLWIMDWAYNTSSMSVIQEIADTKDFKLLKERYLFGDYQMTIAGATLYEDLFKVTEMPAKKKRGQREKATGQYAEEWEIFWNQWPNMRSVPGVKELELKKEFKGNENKCRIKYNAILATNTISADMLNYAAKVYIATGIHNSIRRGKNELEYMSGMEPWLNQGKYMLWVNVEMPGKRSDESVMFTG